MSNYHFYKTNTEYQVYFFFNSKSHDQHVFVYVFAAHFLKKLQTQYILYLSNTRLSSMAFIPWNDEKKRPLLWSVREEGTNNITIPTSYTKNQV